MNRSKSNNSKKIMSKKIIIVNKRNKMLLNSVTKRMTTKKIKRITIHYSLINLLTTSVRKMKKRR